MTPPQDYDDERDSHEERVRLIKTANRLTISFAAWAIVVGIAGTISLLVLGRLWDQQNTQADQARAAGTELRAKVALLESDMALAKLRHENLVARIERLENRR